MPNLYLFLAPNADVCDVDVSTPFAPLQLAAAKERLTFIREQGRKAAEQRAELEIELEQTTKEETSVSEQRAKVESGLEELRASVAELEKRVAATRHEYDEAHAAVEAQKRALSECDSALKKVRTRRSHWPGPCRA